MIDNSYKSVVDLMMVVETIIYNSESGAKAQTAKKLFDTIKVNKNSSRKELFQAKRNLNKIIVFLFNEYKSSDITMVSNKGLEKTIVSNILPTAA